MSEAPRYRDIKRRLIARMRAGELRPGARLPSEHELVQAFGVSRMTANRALRELAAEGWAERRKGAGTFVAAPTLEEALFRIRDIRQDIRSRGAEALSEVLCLETTAAPTAVREVLRLAPETRLFHLVCRHSENGQPVQLEDRWVNPEAVPDFLEQDFGGLSAAAFLLERMPHPETEHVVSAVAADPGPAEALGLETGAPCLLLERRTWVESRPVTAVRLFHPGERYRLRGRFRQADGE